MARIITFPDGSRLVVSDRGGARSLKKGQRRTAGVPEEMANNRLAKRAAMTDQPATAKVGPNNARVAARRSRTQARFS